MINFGKSGGSGSGGSGSGSDGGGSGSGWKIGASTSLHLSSDNFLMYPRTSRGNGCCSDQQSFHQLLKVVGKTA